MEAVLKDIGADALKTGMLGDKRLVEIIAEAFEDLAAGIPRVIDPVMVATSGDALLPTGAIDAVRQLMIPGAALVTPNAPEAEILTGKAVDGVNGQRRAAEKLLEMGADAALVKGSACAGRRHRRRAGDADGRALLRGAAHRHEGDAWHGLHACVRNCCGDCARASC